MEVLLLGRISRFWPEQPEGVLIKACERASRLSSGQKTRTWLFIALCHPELNNDVLERVSNALDIPDLELFHLTAASGKGDFFQFLANKHESDGLLDAMMDAEDYEAFRAAAANGHIDIVRYLERKAPDKLQDMIAAGYFSSFRKYYAFVHAAENGHIDILKYLEEKAPSKLQEMIAENNYQAFKKAAFNGHIEVVNYLAEKAPDNLQDMIVAENYQAFRWAVAMGHIETVKYLEKKAPDKLQDMIAAESYEAFTRSARNGHRHIVAHLLQYATVFAYAEQHVHEYGEYTSRIVTEKLAALRAQKGAAEAANPNAVFTVENPEEAKLLFYVVRHLIRRNNPAQLDNIRFLLEIPAVKELVAVAVTPGEPNELLRLALRIGDETTAGLLLAIPAVRHLVEQNNYYRTEIRSGIDFAVLARDRESSMRALSTEEQARLERAHTHYEPRLRAAGVSHIMSSLRELLKSRYEAHPAFIERAGSKERLLLPMSWEAFQALELTPKERQEALKAYYQHKDHTAFRYLSKPNPWMDRDASFVNINPANPSERWSSFDEYEPLISLLFIAAQDEAIPGVDGYSVETRITHFIDELAHIGRAHNWDETRFKVNAQGEMILDTQGNPIEEEYDNLKGDWSSCYSGVKRRLFQSVQGHPLLQLLTQEIVEQELRDFVRESFQHYLSTEHNAQALQLACERIFIDGEPEPGDSQLLNQLNIEEPKQQQFITGLREKYGKLITSFLPYLRERFSVAQDNHATHFASMVGLMELLEAQIHKDTLRMNALQNPVKKPFVLALERYIKRIESHSDNSSSSRPNFRYGFWFLASSRSANRKANYLLAKELLEKLYAQPDDNIRDLFEQADSLRDEIITKEKINEMPGFVSRGMNSSELQLILDQAARAPGLKR